MGGQKQQHVYIHMVGRFVSFKDPQSWKCIMQNASESANHDDRQYHDQSAYTSGT